MIQWLIVDILIVLTVPFSRSATPDTGQEPFSECRECHSDLVEQEIMHYPAGDACNNCHESTGASHPSEDSAGFRLMDQIPVLCFYCHEENGPVSFAHKPVEDGNCLGCHDAHGSSESSLLLAGDPDLCLSFHNREYRSDSTETANIGRLVKGKMTAHSAIPGGGCMSCHQAHGSGFRSLLVDLYPEEDYLPALTENFGLCFLCHDTDLLEAGETEWGTGFRNGKKNLHRLHINGNKGRNCRMCHNIHGSPRPFLVEEQIVFGSWEMQMNFIPDEQGGSCLPGCHGKLSYQR
ncbi:MAG: cytochrome c3 family protein [Bacteroidales bacterium]|nr:cytochrome c3 family protein [Bacteroidales bacterium]